MCPTPNAESVAPTWQRVTQYVVSAVPEGLCVDGYAWDLKVEWRGDDRWAVTHHSQCLSSKGEWGYEPQPSSRTAAWKRTHRFTEEEALRLAHENAHKVCINGLYPADLVAKYTEHIDGTESAPLCQWCGQPLRKNGPCPCTYIDG